MKIGFYHRLLNLINSQKIYVNRRIKLKSKIKYLALGLLLNSIGLLASEATNSGPGSTFMVSAEYLFWNVLNSDLYYAYNGTDVNAGGVVSKGEISRLKPTAHSGVRVGAAINPSWFAINGKWTYYHNNSTSRTFRSSAPAAELSPVFMNFSGAPNAGAAIAQYSLNVNMGDLYLTHKFKPAPWFFLEPLLGIRGSAFKQNLDVIYSNVAIAGIGGTNNVDSKNTIDFKGIGLRSGINFGLRGPMGFCLFANSAIDLLWTKVDVSETETYLSGGTIAAGTVRNSLKDHYHDICPVLELEVGLAWDGCLPLCGLKTNVHVGWEFQNFINYGHYTYFTELSEHTIFYQKTSCIALSGLTAGVNFYY